MVRAAHERSATFYFLLFVWLVAVVWLVTYDLAILAIFGSMVPGLWLFGLRDKFASEDTDSAYSVFNRGGRSILGGFTGEQLEEQLRGTGSYNTTSSSSGSGGSSSGIAKVDETKPLVTLSSSTTTNTTKMNQGEKLRQRSTAAAAAERRIQQRRQQQQKL